MRYRGVDGAVPFAAEERRQILLALFPVMRRVSRLRADRITPFWLASSLSLPLPNQMFKRTFDIFDQTSNKVIAIACFSVIVANHLDRLTTSAYATGLDLNRHVEGDATR